MPRWRPNCLRGSIYHEPHLSYQPGHDVDTDVFGQDISDEWKGTLVITLQKREGCSLGLTVSGGVDKGQRPHVANLRPGSIAYRCDALMVGDLIISVNEIRTCGLRHEEIINLLKNAGVNVSLEIEYKIPNPGPLSPNIQVKKCDVVLDKEPSGFGFTLRGGMLVESMRSHSLTVLAIRNGGPAHREGSIKVGDQIQSVNGYKVTHLSLQETLGLLSQCESSACFTVAYEAAIMDAVETASGPLDIEIDHSPGIDLGVTLTPSSYNKKACMCVGYLQSMSLADRSGALHEGDHILSIDGSGVEAMSLAEAGQLLKGGAGNSIHLQVVPVTHLEHCAHREMLSNTCLSQSLSTHSGLHANNKSAIANNNNTNNNNNINNTSNSSNYNTNSLSRSHLHHFNNQHSNSSGSSGGGGGGGAGGSGSNSSSAFSSPHHHIHSFSDNSSVALSPFGTLNLRNKRNNWGQGEGRRATSCMSIASSSASVLSNPNQVCHAETIEVILFADSRGMLGMTLKGGLVPSLPMTQPPNIAFVEPRSPADKCGVLLEGDRVLTVNGLETTDRTMEEVNRFLRDSRPRCVLLVEFDVTESVIPSSGTFIVKLLKRSGETGITVNSCSSNKTGQDSLLISDVRRGSVAHRSGSIQAGDKLLAINDVRLTRCTNDDAMHLLELPDDIVKLKLSRDDPDEGHEGFIIYTVELQRFGGPLGITISGTDDPHDPIIISELTPHGLADKTGAIHVGDRLLAVSGDTTKNKPLSEAIRMLQSAGDVVTLKIARPDPVAGKDGLTVQPYDLDRSTPILSVDSAMESCDSSALDLGSPLPNGLDSADATPTATDDFDMEEKRRLGDVMVLAIPQTSNTNDRTDHDFDSRHDGHHTENGELGWSSAVNVDDPKEEIDDDNTTDDTDSNSTHIDDWVKTLEDLDLGSGSEMLRQIGLSLRQRGDHNLEHRSPTSSFSSKSKHRSKSVSRIANKTTASSSSNSIANPQSKNDYADAIQLNGFSDYSYVSNTPNNKNDRTINESNNTNRNIFSTTEKEDIYATPVKKKPTGPKPPITPKPKFLNYSSSSNNKSSSLPPGASLPSSMSPQSPSTPPALPPRKKDGTSTTTTTTKDKPPITSSKTIFTPSPVQLQKVKLEKSEGASEGFGFSLSDGLYERGVFISAINKGSPADRAGLQQYDKLLQVDKVKVQDQDCHQVVPVIAQSGNKLTLIVCRNPLLRLSNSIRQEGGGAVGGDRRGRGAGTGAGQSIELEMLSSSSSLSSSSRGREKTRKGIFR